MANETTAFFQRRPGWAKVWKTGKQMQQHSVSETAQRILNKKTDKNLRNYKLTGFDACQSSGN